MIICLSLGGNITKRLFGVIYMHTHTHLYLMTFVVLYCVSMARMSTKSKGDCHFGWVWSLLRFQCCSQDVAYFMIAEPQFTMSLSLETMICNRRFQLTKIKSGIFQIKFWSWLKELHEKLGLSLAIVFRHP